MQQVIIIGGGPVGLSAAICLANQGIRSTLIEKHPTITNHPKARGVNGRTMELFRSWGVEKDLQQYEMPPEAHRFTWLEDFQGKEITRVQASVDYSVFSPTSKAIISQDCVEEVLYRKASQMPEVTLRFNTEMVKASQDPQKITVEVLNRESGQKETLTSQYMIAADGAKSTLRDRFDVKMLGKDDLGVFCNIYCEMDIDKYVENRPSAGFMFTRPDLLGTFILSKKGHRKWLVGVKLDPSRGLEEKTFTDDFCVEYVKKVINDPQVEVKLINKAFWTMAALIADKFRVGRVFFAGDAAHRLPPTGGFGMNTGVQDAHNLAWKLAMVIKKQADDSLLDTYFQERFQIAKTNMDWSAMNAQRFTAIYTALFEKDIPRFEKELKDQNHHINNIQLDLGFTYGSDYHNQETYQPDVKVGSRAPHCWLQKDSDRLSTLDLFQDSFILLCDPNADLWIEKFKGLPCKIVTIGEHGDYHDIQNDFLEKYKLSSLGAALIRPDGHVAWRSQDENGEMVAKDFGFAMKNNP